MKAKTIRSIKEKRNEAQAAESATQWRQTRRRSHRIRSRMLTLAALTLGLLTLNANSFFVARAQSNLGRRMNDKIRRNGGDAGNASEEGATTPARNPRTTSSSRARRGTSARSAPPVLVTFVADAAGTEILVDTEKVGETDRDGKLLVKVPSGQRTLVASHSGRQTKPQIVFVNTRNNRFNFSMTNEAALMPPTTNASGAATTGVNTMNAGGANFSSEASATSSTSATAGADADEIVRRFRDPQQQSGITLNEWQEVKLQTAQALQQDPSNAKVRALAQFTEGQLAFLHKDYATAVVRFNSAATTLPSSDLAFYGLGNAYLMTNQAGEALRAFQRASEINRDFALAYRGKGEALNRLGKTDEALKEYGRATGLGYASPEVQLQVARALVRKKRWSDAISELKPLATAANPSASVFLLMGEAYQGAKQNVSALEAFRQAIKADGRSAVAFYKQGEVMLAEREYKAAAESFERALALDANGATINRIQARKMANEASRKAGEKNNGRQGKPFLLRPFFH